MNTGELVACILAAVGVAALMFVTVFLVMDDPLTDKELCRYHTIESTGLMACWEDEVCQLSNDEFQYLYVSNKRVAIHCARSLVIELLDEMDAANAEEEEVDPTDDDLRTKN